jgi:hypothetical protein
MEDSKLKELIEKAIKETLVVQNKTSIKYAVEKILNIIKTK